MYTFQGRAATLPLAIVLPSCYLSTTTTNAVNYSQEMLSFGPLQIEAIELPVPIVTVTMSASIMHMQLISIPKIISGQSYARRARHGRRNYLVGVVSDEEEVVEEEVVDAVQYFDAVSDLSEPDEPEEIEIEIPFTERDQRNSQA